MGCEIMYAVKRVLQSQECSDFSVAFLFYNKLCRPSFARLLEKKKEAQAIVARFKEIVQMEFSLLTSVRARIDFLKELRERLPAFSQF